MTPKEAVGSSRLRGALLSPQKERVLENGLVGGHAYTLTGIRKVGGTSLSVSLWAPPSLPGLLT